MWIDWGMAHSWEIVCTLPLALLCVVLRGEAVIAHCTYIIYIMFTNLFSPFAWRNRPKSRVYVLVSCFIYMLYCSAYDGVWSANMLAESNVNGCCCCEICLNIGQTGSGYKTFLVWWPDYLKKIIYINDT